MFCTRRKHEENYKLVEEYTKCFNCNTVSSNSDFRQRTFCTIYKHCDFCRNIVDCDSEVVDYKGDEIVVLSQGDGHSDLCEICNQRDGPHYYWGCRRYLILDKEVHYRDREIYTKESRRRNGERDKDGNYY